MSEKAPQSQPTQKPKRVTIELPKDLNAVYANAALISHSPAEIVLDFAQVLPRTPKGTVLSRIIMSPVHAKLLQMALAQNIANYERQFGEIRLPQHKTLADQLFNFEPPEGSGDEDKPEGEK
ncbi:MAG: DUF3467 domain-containing protein [Chloroflexota bacterium]|jgi:hypothetical protein